MSLRRLLSAAVLSLACCGMASAAVQLEPVKLGPVPANISNTAIAFAGGKFLTVWRQMYMPGVGIWGAFSDGAGKPLTPAFPIIPRSNASFIGLFATGDSFVMQWSEYYGGSYICQIDGAGHVTSQAAFDPGVSIQAEAMVDDRLFAIGSLPGTYLKGLILDAGGRFVRTGLDLAGPFSIASVFPARHSFLVATFGPEAIPTLTRYSLDGARLQSWSIPGATCSNCGTIDGAVDLDSGSVLLLMRSGSQITTALAAPDGSVKVLGGVTVALPYVWRAALQRRGSSLWAIVHAGQRSEGPWRVEAWELDADGRIAGDPTLIVPDPLALYETLVFGEGDQTLLGATTGWSDLQVRTFAYDALKPVAPVILSITPSIQQKSEIASSGTGYLAAWNDSAGERYTEVHWAVLDAAGQPRSAVFSGPGDLYVHSLVSNGFDYLMLVSYGGPLVARRVAADGTLLGETQIVDAPYGAIGDAAAVPTAAGYLVAWSTGNVVRSAVITSSGAMSAPVESARIVGVSPGVASTLYRLALAYDGTDVLLAATRVDVCLVCTLIPGTVGGGLIAVLLRADGTPDSPTTVLDDQGAPNGVVAASSGSEFLVASTTSAFIVRRNGSALTPAKHDLIPATDLIWDGQSYVAVWIDSSKFIVQRLARDGSPLGGALHRGIVEWPAIASDSGRHLVIVASESNGAGPLRATSYVPAELEPQQSRRRAVPR